MTAGGIMDQKTLLDVEPIHGRRLPERIGAMYRMYGRTEGERCGTCSHFYCKYRSERTTYHKCDLNIDTWSRRSDWGKSWPACGLWEQREDKAEEPELAAPRAPWKWAIDDEGVE